MTVLTNVKKEINSEEKDKKKWLINSFMLEFASKPEIVQIRMPSPENQPNEQENQPPAEQPVRELTQNDRINNKLLKSFLSAMNSGQVENADNANSNNDDEDRSAEFED